MHALGTSDHGAGDPMRIRTAEGRQRARAAGADERGGDKIAAGLASAGKRLAVTNVTAITRR
jgi:hypothetical protein